MASGSYLPPPVLAVEIPKPHGGGTRVLGVPTGTVYCAVALVL
jgi:RNA-directed DNA polymerase